MRMRGDMARENDAKLVCELLKRKIEEYDDFPEAADALKEVGREVIEKMLAHRPAWSYEYRELFFQTSCVSCAIGLAIVEAGFVGKVVTIKVDPKIAKQVRDYIAGIDDAHKKAADSKLHFDRTL